MLDALSQRSPLNCCMLKCLQFYISYFRGVEGTGTTVAHCECMRGRKVEAKGEEVRRRWEENQTASPHCNWKILDSLEKNYKKIISGGADSAGASTPNPAPRAGSWLRPREAARHRPKGLGLPTGDHRAGWGHGPTQDPTVGGWRGLRECQGLQAGVLGSPRERLQLPPGPVPPAPSEGTCDSVAG